MIDADDRLVRDERRSLVLAVVLSALLTLIVRLWLAWNDHGIIWPDEIFQTVEPATRTVFGFGWLPWEFQEGLRNWLFPGFLTGILWMGKLVGLDSGLEYMILVKVVLGAFAALASASAVLLGYRASGVRAAWIAAVLVPLFPITLVFDNHPFSESLTAALIVGAAASYERKTRSGFIVSGALALGAAAVRVQMLPIFLCLLIFLIKDKKYSEARLLCLGALPVAALVGVLDWAAWGIPFSSYWRNFQYNVIEGQSKIYGEEPLLFYFEHVARTAGPVIILLIVGMALAARRLPVHVVGIVATVALHTLIAHKELRFIVPLFPYAIGVAAVGLASISLRDELRLSDRLRTPIAAVAGILILAISGAWAANLTFGHLGETRFWEATSSPWKNQADLNRTLAEMGQEDSICGLALVGEELIFSGGYSYFHQGVPFYNFSPQEASLPEVLDPFDAIVTPSDFTLNEPYRRAIASQPGAIGWTRSGGCAPIPEGYSTIFPK